MISFLRRKSTAAVLADAERPGQELRRSLGAFHLTMLGVGAIVGAGIFSSVGEVAAGANGNPGAGPALVVSYILCAIACGFAALCYAEIAAMVPVAGSAYTYSYVAFGEVIAWIIGWDLIIEYAIGNIYVAQSWSDYFSSFLHGVFGVDFPAWMKTDMQSIQDMPEVAAQAPHIGDLAIGINLPAMLIVLLLTVILVVGVRESARFNAGMVVFKVGIVLAFIGIGAFFVEPSNWTPFAPNGFPGVWTGASLAFFSYIGFDAVSTAAEETADPQRNLPRGMIGALVICTVLYILLAVVMTGLVHWSELGTTDPLANALRVAGLDWFSNIVALGAVVAVTSVLLVFMLGQPRIFLAMSRDGLLPPVFGRVHPRFRTPYVGTVLTGLVVAVLTNVMTSGQALELTNIGTLFAFVLVSGGVIALRYLEPDRPRPFKVPLYPLTPLLAIVACVFLMSGLPATNWWRFGLWLLAGLIIYFMYGWRRSRLVRPTGG
ncbi:MAG TPA: amino acid permease [Kofleriaceae bacterium]|nr:amino acid permease [Kofleriaceae bacterium]